MARWVNRAEAVLFKEIAVTSLQKKLAVFGGTLLGLLLILVVASPVGWLLPDQDEFYYFVNRFGESLPAGQNLAQAGQRGPTQEIHSQGFTLYFRWGRRAEAVKMEEISEGQIGVLHQRFGATMPNGMVVAPVKKANEFGLPESDYQGPLAQVLGPGRYRVHPTMYKLEKVDSIKIPAGFVGVVTAKSGEKTPEDQELATEGQKGVQGKVLGSGTYFMNPYMYQVTQMSTQTQVTEFHSDGTGPANDAIEFPSNDGFTIEFDVAVEWQVNEHLIAKVFQDQGDIAALDRKVIVQNTRSISRVEGSKYGAKEFIQGIGREKFEHAFLAEMKRVCVEKGIEILRCLVRKIEVPEELRKPVREAEVARQETLRSKEQMEKAKADAARMEEETKIDQRKKQIEAETAKMVAETQAKQKLAVAEIDLQTAKKEAENTVARGTAEADVIFLKKKADADGTKVMTEAFGGGESLARYEFAKAIAANTTFVWMPSNEGTFWGGSGDNEGMMGNLMKWMVKNQKQEKKDDQNPK
ncbi:MAG: SPFH domain-containing protein [bacterium]|nr:SPFH domain-containing protein [bacterium]